MTVVNLKNNSYDVYIGRPSPWGNPFKASTKTIKEHKRVVSLYREWLLGNIALEEERRDWILANLSQLKGKKLGCFCKPLPCHGDVLIDLLEQQPN